MRLRSRSGRYLIWAVVLAVLTVRASDAHLHLCFDGLEPPTSVHFADASVHHDEHHDTETHADKDFDPLVGLLLKSSGTDFDVPLPVSIGPFVLLPPPASSIVPVASELPPLLADSPFHFRPPLRGPPA